MRAAGLALFGFVAGGMAGLAAALLGLVIWYDGLGMGSSGGDGLSGAAAGMLLVPLLALGGGLSGAAWFARCSDRPSDGAGVAVATVIVGLLGLLALSLMVL